MNKKQKKVLTRIILSAVMLLVFSLLPAKGWLRFVLFLVPYFIIGYDILLKAIKGLKNRQPFDENFLMAAATVGAAALGEYTEGVAVMLFYQIGELFQSCAVAKSRRNIAQLMDIRPDYANIDDGEGGLKRADPDELEPGTEITVLPGERVPIDGIIISGSASLDTAALTGESLPRDAGSGDEVISGSINLSGVIRLKTTKVFAESTVSKILDLVENASSRKSRSENFISRFARIYTPAVCLGALALAIVPPAVLLASGSAPMWAEWIYRALTFLVISCPCALVISIPLSFFAGIGGAGSAGILIKGSNYMETLSKVKCVAFDKTGTVTKGVFELVDVHHATIDRDRLLELAAHAESFSSHPISLSLRRAWGGKIDQSRVSELREISGKGIIAKVDGISVAIGSGKLMEELKIPYVECSSTGTVVHIALDGSYAGHLLIADVLKPSAREAVSRLRHMGIKRTVMLTGDSESVGESIAKELGIDEVHCRLLPADKVDVMEGLLQQQTGGCLAFVGDGVNDAPVLSRADVGIAMGALGSDAAIEAADVVLMDDDPLKISKAIGISRKCMRIVYENIIFALGIKFICLLLGALGLAGMWLAIFADVGVMVLAVLNAVRALNVKKL